MPIGTQYPSEWTNARDKVTGRLVLERQAEEVIAVGREVVDDGDAAACAERSSLDLRVTRAPGNVRPTAS